jgi:hypothetical protein
MEGQAMYKLNAALHGETNQRILEILAERGWHIDARGHAKIEYNGNVWRYHFRARCVRLEKRVFTPRIVFGRMGNGTPVGKWNRIRTYFYSSLADRLGEITASKDVFF